MMLNFFSKYCIGAERGKCVGFFFLNLELTFCIQWLLFNLLLPACSFLFYPPSLRGTPLPFRLASSLAEVIFSLSPTHGLSTFLVISHQPLLWPLSLRPVCSILPCMRLQVVCFNYSSKFSEGLRQKKNMEDFAGVRSQRTFYGNSVKIWARNWESYKVKKEGKRSSSSIQIQVDNWK
jgi:hypothetical protein